MTPWTVAHQAPPSLGFSRQEHWSGAPFPSQMHESESESEDAQFKMYVKESESVIFLFLLVTLMLNFLIMLINIYCLFWKP